MQLRHFAFLAFLLIVTTMVGISAERLQAQTDPVEDPAQIRTIEDGTLLIDPQLLEEEISAEGTPLTTQTDIIDHPMTQWSQWVFESLRNKNDWNIYWSDGARGQYRQLTKSSSDDIHPHLNKGGNRVVFSSNRDGDYELFSINTDGTNLVQLTHNQADDVYPRLSPNGDLIAFTSYRDGQPEIYLMRSDGTGPQRLTYSPAVETMPEWSPVGDKIAFSSNRTGGYRIYTMNINGSNQTQLTTQPFSLRPKWSPSGAYIAYDADANQDGWQEVYKINLNTGVSELVEAGFNSSELLAEGWTPDGSGIVMTLITYIHYRGNYYVTNAVTRLCRSCSYGLDEVVPNSALDMGANWQSMDAQPPQASLSSLDALTIVNTASVNIDASDDLSGVRGSDIQYRLDDGAWQPLVLNTLERTHKLYGPAGSTISLRYRSRDNAWNHSEWKEVSPATTFYAYATTGQVSANTRVPISDLALIITPDVINQPITDQTGTFTAYIAQRSSHQVLFPATDYGTFGPVKIPNGASEINFYLPPADDLIENGDLEVRNNNLPTSWTANNQSLIKMNDPGLTGAKSVLFGEPCPLPCMDSLQTETLELKFTPLGVYADDKGNTFTTTYAPQPGNTPNYYLLMRNQAGDFETFKSFRNWDQFDSAVMGEDGKLHFIAKGESWKDAFYTFSFEPPNQWSERQLVWEDELPASETAFSNFYVDQNGHQQFMRHTSHNSSSKSYLHQQLPDGSWAEPILITEDRNLGFQTDIDSDGNVHFVWIYDGIHYRRLSKDGKLSGVRTLDKTTTTLLLVKVDNEGALHILASDNYFSKPDPTLTYYKMAADGTLSPPVEGILPDDMESAIGTVDAGNTLHVAYQVEKNDRIDYVQLDPQGKWTEPVNIGAGEDLALFTFEPDGCWFQMIAYDQLNSNATYRTCKTSAESSSTGIQQTVTIPSTMANPVLSFMAQRQHMFDLSRSPLEVLIQAGEERVSYELPLPSTAWTQQVVDLSAWSGQTIEVEIGVSQAAHDPFAQIAIDAISLGSGHPDLASSVLVPPVVQPGQTFTVALSAENRSIISADNASVTLSLPSSIEYVGADVAPDGRGPLRWDLGQLSAETPATMLVTLLVREGVQANRTVNLTAELSTDSAEIETDNNQQTQAVFLGHRTYLPNLIGH